MGAVVLDRLAAHMDATQREVLRTAMAALEVDAGHVLFRDGQPLDALHVVDTGALGLSIDVDGRDVALGRITPGGFTGELSLLDPTTAHATATALEPTRILKLSREALTKLRATDTVVASLLLRALVEDLAERVRHANTIAVDDAAAPKRGWFESALAKLFGGGA